MEQDHIRLWDKCLEIFRDNLPKEQFDAWFQPVASMSYVDGRLNLAVPSPYFVEHLEGRYIGIISKALHKVYGPDVKLFYHYNQVSNEPTTGVTIESSQPSPAVTPRPGAATSPFAPAADPQEIDPQLNPRYTFENYCRSNSNSLARSIGEAIADDPKLKTFNPLFIFGSPGVGKTHLIQAIGIRIKERFPRNKVLYVTARLFESQYTTARLKGRINEFIYYYQSIDTLIIDDIQDLIGKPGTQGTFFHIFNHLQLNQKQIILSSDTRPSQMEGMEKRMLDRFKWGMTAELEKPDYSLRRDVLRQKASREGVEIPDDVLDYIAANVTESIRELEGIMVALVAHATFSGGEINLDVARSVMANAVKINRRQLNFEIIAEAVSTYYKIEPDQLFTKSRKREISDARQMVMFMTKKHTKMGLKAIGSRLGRSHATVLYSYRNIEERLPLEKRLQEDVAKIEANLLG